MADADAGADVGADDEIVKEITAFIWSANPQRRVALDELGKFLIREELLLSDIQDLPYKIKKICDTHPTALRLVDGRTVIALLPPAEDAARARLAHFEIPYSAVGAPFAARELDGMRQELAPLLTLTIGEGFLVTPNPPNLN